MTRYEQAEYAKQLRSSPFRDSMASEVGESAFSHYLRTDDSGARPIPRVILEKWIEAGWIARVLVPSANHLPPVPATILDPFGGSGTTGMVARQEGRACVMIELNPEYAAMHRARVMQIRTMPESEATPIFDIAE